MTSELFLPHPDASEASQFLKSLEASKRIAALTGAGISTAAGLPDFRGPRGLYTTDPQLAQRLFDWDCFRQNPKPFYDMMRKWGDRLMNLKPTIAHRFLADLERKGRLCGIVTQNIDDLHQKAGSRQVITLHGSWDRFYCIACGRDTDLPHILNRLKQEDIPQCPACGGLMRPDIVFFKEAVRDWSKAVACVSQADCLLVIGTSAQVYPAASLPSFCPGEMWVINQEPVDLPQVYRFQQVQTDIEEFFQICRQILSSKQTHC